MSTKAINDEIQALQSQVQEQKQTLQDAVMALAQKMQLQIYRENHEKYHHANCDNTDKDHHHDQCTFEKFEDAIKEAEFKIRMHTELRENL